MSAIDRDKNLAEGSVIVKNESAVKTCEEGANKTDVFNSVTCDFVRETRLVLLPEAFPTLLLKVNIIIDSMSSPLCRCDLSCWKITTCMYVLYGSLK